MVRSIHVVGLLFLLQPFSIFRSRFTAAQNFGPFHIIVKNLTACEDPGTNQINFSDFQLKEKVYNKRTKNKDIPIFSYKLDNEYPINSKTQLSVDVYQVKTKTKWISKRLGGFCQMMSGFIPGLYENFLLANGVKQCNIPKGNHTVERFKLDVNPQFPSGPYGRFRGDIIMGVKRNDRLGCFSIFMDFIKKEEPT